MIHFDRWWNPGVEDQATDRAHRIGQTRNVYVHKIICRQTLEEKIDRLIEKLEASLRENQDNIVEIRKEINRLKLQAFEEDIREQDSRQLLNG